MCSLNTSSFYSFHSKDNEIFDILSIHPIFSLPLFIMCSFNISTFYNYFHSRDNSQSNLLTSSPFFQSILGPLLSCVFQHFAILQIFPQQVQFLTKSVHIFSILSIFPQALFPSSASSSPFCNSFHSKDNFQSNLSTSSPLFQYFPRPFLACVFNSSPFYNIKDHFHSNLLSILLIFSNISSFPTIISTSRTIFI